MPTVKLQSGSGSQNVHYEFDTDSRNLLGEGGMGRVFRGKQIETGNGGLSKERDVAIKLLFDDLPEHAIKRARREASIRLKNDNLVEMIDFVETHENYTTRYHVVSELLNGVNLDNLLEGVTNNRDGQPNPAAERLLQAYNENRKSFVGEVFRSILSGITALHDAGYIHRDIDPSNIMVTSKGKIKLIDFGITKKVDELNTSDRQFTSTGQFVGKIHYAAPEQILGDIKTQSYTTDIYTLGINLFQLYVGHLPFEGPYQDVFEKQLHEDPPLKEVDDKTLRKIIGKATQKDPRKRYQSASEFRVDIDRWMSEAKYPKKEKKPKTPKVKKEKAPKDKREIDATWLKKVGLAVAGVAVVVVAVWFIHSLRPEEESIELIEENDTARFYVKINGHDTIERWYEKKEIETPPVHHPDRASLNEAKKLLSDTSRGRDGLEMLQRLVDEGDYGATFLMSRLFFDPTNQKGLDFYKDEWSTMRENCGITTDNEEAHALLYKAFSEHEDLACQDCDLLYELGCDYMYDNRRGPKTKKIQSFAYWCFNALDVLTEEKTDPVSVQFRKVITNPNKDVCQRYYNYKADSELEALKPHIDDMK